MKKIKDFVKFLIVIACIYVVCFTLAMGIKNIKNTLGYSIIVVCSVIIILKVVRREEI